MSKYEKGAPIPSALGRVADMLHETRQLRIEMQKEVDAVKARETELNEHLINSLSKSDDTGVMGLKYQARVITETKPKPADWQKIFDYIAENDRFDLLQKRLSDKAVMETIEEEGSMPGVERIHVPKISLRKIN